MRSLIATLVVVLAGVLAAQPLLAQRPDSTARPPVVPRGVLDTASGPRPELKPPLSAGRAFAYSFIVPGYAQTVLGRPRAGALFIAFEVLAVTMLRQARFDLGQARAAGADSVVASWWNPATNQAGPVRRASPYDVGLVRSRSAHVEDWIAVLIANHLASGLDAYVAAHLWDVPAELLVHPTSDGARIGISLRVR
ncbi:MAG TPA: hypothetical protein VFK16_03070 [Gemmatimonadaceae bacterium]|nr:hypothetical protein [Gemmatimonadaceae bacterium]